MAEEEAGRDSLKPPVCPCLLLSWAKWAFPVLASCLRCDITPACCPSRDSAPCPALASQTLLADRPHLALLQCFPRRTLAQAWSSPWAEPGPVLRALTYTVHFLVCILLIQSPGVTNRLPGMECTLPGALQLPSPLLPSTIAPASACHWASRTGAPQCFPPSDPSLPPGQYCSQRKCPG